MEHKIQRVSQEEEIKAQFGEIPEFSRWEKVRGFNTYRIIEYDSNRGYL